MTGVQTCALPILWLCSNPRDMAAVFSRPSLCVSSSISANWSEFTSCAFGIISNPSNHPASRHTFPSGLRSFVYQIYFLRAKLSGRAVYNSPLEMEHYNQINGGNIYICNPELYARDRGSLYAACLQNAHHYFCKRSIYSIMLSMRMRT